MSGAHTRVCVVGSGGREHALALALARSADVVVTPGNPGMPGEGPGGTIRTTDLPAHRVDADLYVVGPERPLVEGLADGLRAMGRRVVGPGARGAALEGSKAFMKELLVSAGVPTADHGVFSSLPAARAYLRTLPGPWVVKADGLAAGKGVLVATSLDEAEDDVEAKLSGSFGDAGRRVVIEEGLVGAECSLLALCDGRHVLPLAPARDFKRVGDGDTGPNTGGMGAYAPVPEVDDALVDELVATTLEPLVGELRTRDIDYRGVLYAGLMLTPQGPRVLEFNARFGDPEAQVVLALLAEDPVALLGAVADGDLAAVVGPDRLAPPQGAAVCVVLAAGGYPGAPATGEVIEGLADDGQLASPVAGVVVHHAGTARQGGGPFVVAGGRVLGVTARGADLDDARAKAYEAVETLHWPGMVVRTDIACRAAGAARVVGGGT